ncbi:MAG: hypothetical protein RBU30_23115 [Polyangia bacterium]|nr:hypothetical protein [Polyangia bacterium]
MAFYRVRALLVWSSLAALVCSSSACDGAPRGDGAANKSQGAAKDASARPAPAPAPDLPEERSSYSEADAQAANELLMQAQKASLSNQYGAAMRLAMQSIRKKPSKRAWAVYGAAACGSGNKNAAKKAFKNLSGGMRGMLVTLCKNKGIQLP